MNRPTLYPWLHLLVPLSLLASQMGVCEESEVTRHSAVYKQIGDVTLSVEVLAPDEESFPGPRPAIVFFHGGGWRGGQRTQFEPQAKHYASLGIVGVLVEYRVSSRHTVTPIDCLSDARSALRWVRGKAAELGIDPNRIAACGGSAGGHLAVCAALVSGLDNPSEDLTVSATPDAVIAFNPKLNLEGAGARLGLDEDRLLSISPFHRLNAALPPTLLLHGVEDQTVPISESRDFADKARTLGCRCELEEYPGEGHGFFNSPHPENYRVTLERCDRFLRSLEWIE